LIEAADDTSPAVSGNPEQLLKQLIEAQRLKLLQSHAVMICLHEVLLYAEDDRGVIYAKLRTLPHS
jgi:hypothetical protein